VLKDNIAQGVLLPDSHVHSRSSFDSKEPVSAQCRAALKKGFIGYVTVTDHCEINVNGTEELWSFKALRRSQQEAWRAKKRFEKKLKVFSGVELGQPAYCPEQARQVLAAGTYDFVLASVHYLRDGRDFYYLNYHESDPYEVYDRYLEELLETVRFGDFDVLAHITYPLRYIFRDGIDFDQQRYVERFERILTMLADMGKGLEINTKGALYPGGRMLPEADMLRLFRSVGGKYITLGSDSHRATQMSVGIETGAKLALEAGFDSVYYYVDRKPVEVKLAHE